MRVSETSEGQFVVARGGEYRPQYFSFYIDHDSSSWTKYIEQAHKHATRASATETIHRLRHRAQLRRDEAKRALTRSEDRQRLEVEVLN